MSDSFSQRKYAGLPVHELKQIPKEPIPKSFHGATNYKDKKDIEITDLWKIRPKSDKKHYWYWDRTFFSVHVGVVNRWGYHSAPGHVIRRFKAHLMRSKSLGVWWLENEATKEQISPEFHNYDCFLDWLIFEGMSRGWIYVESGKQEWWDRKEKKQKVRRWTRLATT